MGLVDDPELREVEAALELESKGECLRGQERLFQFDPRLANLRIDQVDDMGLTGEIGIHGARERQFDVLHRETASAWVVVTPLEVPD
jgi:hypothetical protein